MGPLLTQAGAHWSHMDLAQAGNSGDDGGILDSSADTAAGCTLQITAAAAKDELAEMAWWTWPGVDIHGQPLGPGDAPLDLQAMLTELSANLQSDLLVLVGFLDGDDPTAAFVNGFGCGLGFPSGGGNVRSPYCWSYAGGTWSVHSDAGADDSSVQAYFSAGRRLGLFREFTASGHEADGDPSSSSARAFLLGGNVDMSGADPVHFVLGIGCTAAVTAEAITVLASWLGYPAPAGGYVPVK